MSDCVTENRASARALAYTFIEADAREAETRALTQSFLELIRAGDMHAIAVFARRDDALARMTGRAYDTAAEVLHDALDTREYMAEAMALLATDPRATGLIKRAARHYAEQKT
jgi:hypothetical protein